MTKPTIKYTEWNFSLMFDGDNDPKLEESQKEATRQVDSFAEKWNERTDYLEDPEALLEALNDYELLMRNYGPGGHAHFYFMLRVEQDQTDSDIKAKFNKADSLARDNANKLQFFTVRLSKVDEDRQAQFLSDKRLSDYRHYLETLFERAQYLLSESEEKILMLKAQPAYENWERMTQTFLSREEREILDESGSKKLKSFSEIMGLLNSKNKEVRDGAADALNDILVKIRDIAVEEINSLLLDKKIDDTLRGQDRPELSRLLDDDIKPEVLDTLLDTVTKRFSIAQDYYALKARLMGVEKLGYHERNVPYGTVEEKYTFEQAYDLTHRVFSQLDPKFVSILEDYLENGKIDIYPRKGKRGGAFAVLNLLSEPGYVMLNHNDTLNDTLTLAHEMGHAIHHELIRENQNSLNAIIGFAVAEVASNFMEDFLLDEILKSADDEARLSIMMSKLNDDVSSIIRQLACIKFEQELHASFRDKGYLSGDEIGEIFQKHMKSYMGPAVDYPEGSKNWWVYWGHIRRYFYNYSYSFSLMVSKSLQSSVRKNPEFIENVKEIFKAGSSLAPIEMFANVGIDIEDGSFWDKALDEVESLLKETEALAKKLGKI